MLIGHTKLIDIEREGLQGRRHFFVALPFGAFQAFSLAACFAGSRLHTFFPRFSVAFRFSARLGFCSGQEAGRVANHLALAGLPTRLAAVPGGCGDADALLDAMAQDKKVRDGALTFILARGIGRSFIAPGIERAAVRAFLEDELRA